MKLLISPPYIHRKAFRNAFSNLVTLSTGAPCHPCGRFREGLFEQLCEGLCNGTMPHPRSPSLRAPLPGPFSPPHPPATHPGVLAWQPTLATRPGDQPVASCPATHADDPSLATHPRSYRFLAAVKHGCAASLGTRSFDPVFNKGY